MSLKDPEDEYDDILPDKKKGKVGKAASKMKTFVVLLIIGMVLGAVISHMYVEPILKDMESSTCKSCLESKELLSKENDCLYQQVPDARAAATNCTKIIADMNYNPPADDNLSIIDANLPVDNNSPPATDTNAADSNQKGF